VTDDLFFIPIIAEALRSKDRQTALQAAFDRIQEQGKQARYRKGLTQFEEFMQTVREHGQIELIVERDGVRVGTIRMDPAGGPFRMGGIGPGRYAISLSTGRLLWEAELGDTDLVWSRAFPCRPLGLAADTAGTKRLASRKESLDGGLTLLVFPGAETGEIGIEMSDAASSSNG
jgi:hypothetical protein